MVTSLTKKPETEQAWEDFSKRLNELLDARGFTQKGHGRQVKLAEKYKLTQKGVRKWVEAEGMPKTTQLIQLAKDFNCQFEWLATGRGPRDMDPALSGPYAQLMSRIESATPETRTLIELALMSQTDLERTKLTPSLKGLIGYVKQQIGEESTHGPAKTTGVVDTGPRHLPGTGAR
jgi:transcriptional regulator with XRE-family HTH domain